MVPAQKKGATPHDVVCGDATKPGFFLFPAGPPSLCRRAAAASAAKLSHLCEVRRVTPAAKVWEGRSCDCEVAQYTPCGEGGPGRSTCPGAGPCGSTPGARSGGNTGSDGWFGGTSRTGLGTSPGRGVGGWNGLGSCSRMMRPRVDIGFEPAVSALRRLGGVKKVLP